MLFAKQDGICSQAVSLSGPALGVGRLWCSMSSEFELRGLGSELFVAKIGSFLCNLTNLRIFGIMLGRAIHFA